MYLERNLFMGFCRINSICIILPNKVKYIRICKEISYMACKGGRFSVPERSIVCCLIP